MKPYQHTANSSSTGDRTGWVGWYARIDRGRLRLTGADTLGFLQALVTNDVAALAVGESRDAAYLTKEGRMITDMRIFRGADDVIVSVPAELAESLAVRLDFLIFAEDVQIADASQLIHEITLVGATMAHTKDVFFPVEQDAAVRAELVNDGLPELDATEVEAMRIEAGIPKWGLDLTDHTIPIEAGLLDRAISRTKGCYVGQEVIVRILDRGEGRVAKRLMKMAFGPDVVDPPAPGTQIQIDHATVGYVTSSARSKRLGRVVAMGYINRDHANDGVVVAAGPAVAVLQGTAG